ncbi:MAG: hypothetical protein OEN23_13545 [Paracoccaceae bacterium]|nr:hypothetical protein [Paracoccaceae bacterium]
MRILALTMAGILLAAPSNAGELISGTNSYETTERWWMTTDGSGYYMYDSEGQIEMKTGPLPDGPVECHGAGFWSPRRIQGEGVCIFGAPPHRWTVTFIMDPESRVAKTAEGYQRRGTWMVANGSGKYLGMTGSGTFITDDVVDMKKTTHWEGEVELPK